MKTALSSVALFVLVLGPIGCGGGDAMKHEPDPYRQRIEPIEALLQKPAADEGDCGRLHTLSADLAGAVAQDIQNHTHKEIVMNRLVGFGQEFAGQEEQGLGCDLEGARAMWKALRTELFIDADWFKSM